MLTRAPPISAAALLDSKAGYARITWTPASPSLAITGLPVCPSPVATSASVPQAMKDGTAQKHVTRVGPSPATTAEPVPPGLEASTVPALRALWGCAVRGTWTSVSTGPATLQAPRLATL